MLDLIDRKIIYLLDKNARQSFSQIAKQLRIGRNVVLYRVNRLKEQGMIKGAFAEINNPSLGYFSFRVFLKIGNSTQKTENELLEFIEKNNSTMWLSRVIGKWDLDFVIMVKDISEFENFRKKLFLDYNSIIEFSSISLLTSITHFQKDYLMNENRKSGETLLKLDKKVDIDQKDLELLILLTKDAFINILDISKKLNLSINTVKKKIKFLEKSSVILGYRLFIDTHLLGYEHFKVHLSLRNYNESDIIRLKNWLSSNIAVIYLDNYINGEDFEIELHLKNEQEYLDFIEELKSEFSKIIKEYFMLKFYDVRVFRYLPIEKH